jgi:hypothetical protein
MQSEVSLQAGQTQLVCEAFLPAVKDWTWVRLQGSSSLNREGAG